MRRVEEPFSDTLVRDLVVKKPVGSYFDSADWSLSLHGLLEYPLNTVPHPIMCHFSKEDVALIAHPEHEKVWFLAFDASFFV